LLLSVFSDRYKEVLRREILLSFERLVLIQAIELWR
jgi:hypothetical protein